MSDRNSFLGSIKGSIKDKLSRSPSNASQGSTRQPRHQPQPQVQPVRLSAGATSGRGISANPFSNPFSTAAPPTQVPHNEPPPAYTSAPTGGASAYPSAPSPAYAARDPSPTPSRFSAITVTTPEDQYAFLSSFDTIFLIDDSGSMVGRSWREVQSALSSITPICTAHDADGVDIYFLNHRSPYPASQSQGKASGGYANVKDVSAVDRIFTSVRPGGMTPTGTRLNHILKAYLRHYEAAVERAGGDPDATDVKPINVIMITDGVPSDDPESVLLSVAQKLDRLEAPPHQVGVQFFQVGNEPGAADALRTLDDDLAEMGGGVRDMVDTVSLSQTTLSGDGILKVVLGAVVKRLDRARIMDAERRSQRSGRSGMLRSYGGGEQPYQRPYEPGPSQEYAWQQQPSYHLAYAEQPLPPSAQLPYGSNPPAPPPPHTRPSADSSQRWEQQQQQQSAWPGNFQERPSSSQLWQQQQEQALHQSLLDQEEEQRAQGFPPPSGGNLHWHP
ncbi:von willebrand factor [Diaporthe eres]|nr:von willebrand factor [Diaporthe eres]